MTLLMMLRIRGVDPSGAKDILRCLPFVRSLANRSVTASGRIEGIEISSPRETIDSQISSSLEWSDKPVPISETFFTGV